MLDIKRIEENPDAIRRMLADRGIDLAVDRVLDLSRRRRALLHEVEELKAERNRASQEIGVLKKAKKDTTEAQRKTRALSERIKTLDREVGDVRKELDGVLLTFPNIVQPDVPVGEGEDQNVEIRKWGAIPSFDFKPQAHWDLGEKLGILDFARGSKLSGARFTVLRREGAALERALIHFMLDMHLREHGYEEILPPYLVTRESMTNTGQLPKFEAEAFKIAGDRELFLIPTAEVPVTNLHAKEIVAESALPIRYAAFSPCFRAEAGSYGQDVRGLIRQHQFHKVELVQFVHPDRSREAHEELTRHAEKVLEALELPYRRMLLCTGDMSEASSKTYDLEVWLPGQETYREISSCSNFLDYQARRAGIRFRPEGGGKPLYLHTLNGSGLAVGRTLVALLENYQQADGSVRIPKALQRYMGVEVIRP